MEWIHAEKTTCQMEMPEMHTKKREKTCEQTTHMPLLLQ